MKTREIKTDYIQSYSVHHVTVDEDVAYTKIVRTSGAWKVADLVTGEAVTLNIPKNHYQLVLK